MADEHVQMVIKTTAARQTTAPAHCAVLICSSRTIRASTTVVTPLEGGQHRGDILLVNSRASRYNTVALVARVVARPPARDQGADRRKRAPG
jgi:hypothetical protein